MSKPVLYLFNGKVARFGSGVFGFIPAEVYTVTLDTVSHGSISASPMSGSAGTTISLSSTPDSGYELDYFTVNGVSIIGNTFTMPADNVTVGAVFKAEQIILPQYTIRAKTAPGTTIKLYKSWPGSTITAVQGQDDVYDVYVPPDYRNRWDSLFQYESHIVEILGINCSGVTSMKTFFGSCTNLRTVAQFDTSGVGNMANMFIYCSSLQTVPLLDTSSASDTSQMFYDCTSVQSGALALYQQASSQTNPPSSHSSMFKNCGKDTVTGAAELAQIPSSWGGTGA